MALALNRADSMSQADGPSGIGRMLSSARAGEQFCESAEFGGKGGGEVRGIDIWQERQRHDDDRSPAGSWDGSQVGSALAAGRDLAQVVHGAGVLVDRDAYRELPAVLARPPSRPSISNDGVGKSRRPVRDPPQVDEQRHDIVGLGAALDALGLGTDRVGGSTVCRVALLASWSSHDLDYGWVAQPVAA